MIDGGECRAALFVTPDNTEGQTVGLSAVSFNTALELLLALNSVVRSACSVTALPETKFAVISPGAERLKLLSEQGRK